jgi:DNA replicative helicase MCM subunit Mcm2 (Cdc46/Mcm family)
MEEDLVVVIDLDGTLISDELAKKIYIEAYIETLKIMRERGIKIPEEFSSHSFENYRELAKRYKEFKRIYETIYPKVMEKHIDDVRREEGRARLIYYYLVIQYRPKSVYVLTANPKGDYIISEILPEIPRESIIVVDGIKYVENKKKVLENLKNLGKVLYVADRDDIDRPAAEEAGVYYCNVETIIEELKEKEKGLYGTKIVFPPQTKFKSEFEYNSL